MTIRLLIADDHPVVRHGVQHLLSADRDIVVVGEAGTGPQVFEQVQQLCPDVILLDIKLPGTDGIEITGRLRRTYPALKVIILTAHHEEEYVLGALRAGAHGFLLKQASYDRLADAIHSVYAGERQLSPDVTTRVLEEFETMARTQLIAKTDLTVTELRILNHIAAGDSTKTMAEKLHWSEATLNRRIHEMMTKLNVSNRAHAVAEAMRRGLI